MSGALVHVAGHTANACAELIEHRDVLVERFEKLDEALKLLQYERETWAMLMEKAASGEPAGSGAA